MNKLYALAHRRWISKLDLPQSNVERIGEVLSAKNLPQLPIYVFHRVPRDEMKDMVKIPCPIESLYSKHSEAIITTSKMFRKHFRMNETTTCMKCPFRETCTRANIEGEEATGDILKPLVQYSQALVDYALPENIPIRTWISAYKIADTWKAVIEDLLENNLKEINEFEAIRQHYVSTAISPPPVPPKPREKSATSKKPASKNVQEDEDDQLEVPSKPREKQSTSKKPTPKVKQIVQEDQDEQLEEEQQEDEDETLKKLVKSAEKREKQKTTFKPKRFEEGEENQQKPPYARENQRFENRGGYRQAYNQSQSGERSYSGGQNRGYNNRRGEERNFDSNRGRDRFDRGGNNYDRNNNSGYNKFAPRERGAYGQNKYQGRQNRYPPRQDYGNGNKFGSGFKRNDESGNEGEGNRYGRKNDLEGSYQRGNREFTSRPREWTERKQSSYGKDARQNYEGARAKSFERPQRETFQKKPRYEQGNQDSFQSRVSKVENMFAGANEETDKSYPKRERGIPIRQPKEAAESESPAAEGGERPRIRTLRGRRQ